MGARFLTAIHSILELHLLTVELLRACSNADRFVIHVDHVLVDLTGFALQGNLCCTQEVLEPVLVAGHGRLV